MKFLTLLALMCCCCLLRGHAMHLTRPRPRPLDSSSTWNNLFIMTKHAQMEDTDHETRLLPVFSEVMLKEESSCCVNSMILNYYLKHILHPDEHVDKKYPHIRFVRSDLQRIAHILKPHCENLDFVDHVRVKEFEKNYKTASEQAYEKTRNKAVGETIILFHYLFESCNPRI
ncbi:interleukin-22 [Carassius gibelio]|uniref:interleukin-22 n=1 Tax=Carassius gibelio TaxID=101364 RepID=UPI00227829AF|nr:interleukin-22 [Carassius gibelio]